LADYCDSFNTSWMGVLSPNKHCQGTEETLPIKYVRP